MKVKRSLELLKEVITPENVEAMSEMIAICELKYLIRYIGNPMIEMFNHLIDDINHKYEIGFAFSDSYDLVQEVAVVLCGNFGKKLNDIHHIDKKGRKISIEIQADREIAKIVNRKFRRIKTDYRLESMIEEELPYIEFKDEPAEDEYEKVDNIISNLDLNDTQLTALNCRMAGMSYP